MGFFNNLFGKKETPIANNADFWKWFQSNSAEFFKIVKEGKNIQRDFFGKLSPQLAKLQDDFYFLTGMADDHKAELILTPDGKVKNIVLIEALVQSAPAIPNWKFTALKPTHRIEDVRIDLEGCVFDSENLSFYAVDHKSYPDEVDIVIVRNDDNEDDRSKIIQGTYLFLDNYLGELNFVTTIDNLTVIPKSESDSQHELIPISKLKDFLVWREKEFVEKYDGIRYDTENDSYSSLEATLNNGRPLIAIINTTLLDWDRKASHPWILKVEIKYNGDNNNGFPDNETYQLLNVFEDEIMHELKDFDGYLNIGRETADNTREIYFACKDFRRRSKILHSLMKKYAEKLEADYEIYKDKYWQSFERFMAN